MAISLQPYLAGIRQFLVTRHALRLRFHYQVIVLFHSTGNIAAKGYFSPGKPVGSRVVNIYPGNIKSFGRLKMVDILLYAVGIPPPIQVKILGNELIRTRIFLDQRYLPGQIISHYFALEFGKLRTYARVYIARNRWKIIPVVYSIAPIIQTESGVHFVNRPELGFEIFYKLSVNGFANITI